MQKYFLLIHTFALHKCELTKNISASLYNLSQNFSKYASDIDHAVTFSSKEGKQYQIEWVIVLMLRHFL